LSKTKARGEVKKHLFIFLHGWGGDRNSLQPLAEAVKTEINDCEVLVIEFPGAGSTELPEVFTMRDYVAWLRSELDSLVKSHPASKVTFIGHSFGGKTLLFMLSRENQFPQANLVLINSSGIKPRNSRKKVVFKLIAKALKPVRLGLQKIGLERLEQLLRKAFYKYVVRERDYEKIDSEILKKTFQNVVDTHLDIKQLAKIANPTLLLWAGEDSATPLWMGQLLDQNISNSKLVVFPEATHGLPLKQPQDCAREIAKFTEEE
jgi:pimeloyl-ACP methyl ester carboxylesterase